jgi:hypothetical protein
VYLGSVPQIDTVFRHGMFQTDSYALSSYLRLCNSIATTIENISLHLALKELPLLSHVWEVLGSKLDKSYACFLILFSL